LLEASVTRTKKFLASLAACGSVGLFVLTGSSLVDTSSAAADVTASPMPLKFKTGVGNITYGMVTITNTGGSSETLTGAVAPNPPFWPTWGGSCNLPPINRVVLPGRSCTFQFGFKPTQKGHVSGQGTMTFQSGTTLTVELDGVGQ
jgi:hypothetical protein